MVDPVADSPEIDAAAATSNRVPASLDEFLASVERRAFRLAQLALGQREDALDVVQDSMIKLMQYRHRPAGEWTPLFWSILRRQLTDRHRRNAVRNRVMNFFGRSDDAREDSIEAWPDPSADPARRVADQSAWQALGRALRALPARQRECFLLRELQGLSVAETAAAMGCSDGSVKTHLSRALSALRTHLEDWR
ncbi:MAG TPA: RNA polymerase sigma factor [Luteimonas sp.]|nr:RNA polymerase sigma factor [Luteimonas sp.]